MLAHFVTIVEREAGLDMVARNDLGNLVQAWAVVNEAIDIPVVAKLEAVMVALLVTLQNSWRRVEVEVEIKAIVDSLKQRTSPILETATIADDIFLLI